MSQPDVIPTFLSTPLHKQGQELRSEQTVASHNLYLFLRLNNSETFVELVGATPLHLLSQTALPLKSPTGAFIAPLRCANAVPPQTLLRTDEEELCQIDTIPPQQFMRVKLQNNARHIPRIFPEIPAAYPDHYTSHGWTSEIRYSRMERREKGTFP